MDLKHQVFVSSTYKDLIEERKHVIHALLELDCIPSGMELFPATDEDAWSLIKEVIDGSDYYILILAGRYGSLGPQNISFTEMEYDYALKSGKPILCFLHADPNNIVSSKTEKDANIIEKLEAFREKVRKKHCKFYTSPEDLGGKISRSLIQLRKKHPGEGWIRGRYAMTDQVKAEFESMRARIAELELELVRKGNNSSLDTSDLSQGNETIQSTLNLKVSKWAEPDEFKKVKIIYSWNDILKYVGPALQGEGSEKEFKYKIQLLLYHKIKRLNKDAYDRIRPQQITFPLVTFDKIKIQLQALGLIEPGSKRRSVSDSETYWSLTKKGQQLLINLEAKRKPASKSKNGVSNLEDQD